MFLRYYPILLVVLLDQSSKIYLSHFYNDLKLPCFLRRITSFLNLVLTENRGISFSLGAEYDLRWPLVALITMVVGWLLYMIKKASKGYIRMGFSLAAGGAIGNLIDRIYNGAVIDFIELHYKDLYWPAFNFADLAINVGMGMVLLKSLGKSNFDQI